VFFFKWTDLMTNQFEPGSSGNPGGRPPEIRERTAFIRGHLSDRAMDLFNRLTRKIGRGRLDIHTEMHAIKVAELQAGCEALRLMMKTTEPSAELINSITRLESTTARAERALFKAVPPKAEVHVPLREKLARAAARQVRRGDHHGEA
jgi:hypothetical protein